MRDADAIVVGGGPAGSTCARDLVRAGMSVIVLDKAAFPRTKLCAGWVTPEALADLELAPEDYPLRLNRFDRLHLHWKAVSLAPSSLQYSIRRFEFDDFLLEQSGAEVLRHTVHSVRESNGRYLLDDRFRCRFLIGAAGTSCPVYRSLFRERHPRPGGLQTATLEREFAYDWESPECHLWFFDDGLPGYAWYVPKENAYVNIGIGAMAGQLRQRDMRLKDAWRRFADKVGRLGLVDCDGVEPQGYSYFLRGPGGACRSGNAFLVGDSAGLATRDLCEGIGPAIRSARLAAEAIIDGTDYRLESVPHLSGGGWASRFLERRFAADGKAA